MLLTAAPAPGFRRPTNMLSIMGLIDCPKGVDMMSFGWSRMSAGMERPFRKPRMSCVKELPARGGDEVQYRQGRAGTDNGVKAAQEEEQAYS